MTFLNPALLAALAAVAVPILIHLLHRRRATVMDWGAMRFLLRSMAARKRRLLLEEMVLLGLRCLLVALLVLAVARPFVPIRSAVPWAVVLPAALVAAVLAGVGTAMWANRRVRWALWAVAALLLIGAGAATALEHARGREGLPAGRGEKDVAVVIDGSMSMTLVSGGRSNFERAVAEARAVLAACRPGDAVSVILAGPAPMAATAGPITDRDRIGEILDGLEPVEGRAGIVEALNFASAALAGGHHAAKTIVLITDGQKIGWGLENEARWMFLASGLAQLPQAPEVLCRFLPVPRQVRNAAIADVTFSRRVIGTDRPVGIDVRVVNTGTAPSGPFAVELTVEGATAPAREIASIPAGAAETVRFTHRFSRPGFHVAEANLIAEDDIPGDDAAVRVAEAIERLPVLIVDGAPSGRPLDSAATFMAVAMAPGRATDALIVPRVVPVIEPELAELFDEFRVVVLANVARIPESAARALARFVREGGGLLIAPGDRAEPEFYEWWKLAGAEPVAPAALLDRTEAGQRPVRPSLNSFSHPALSLLADPAESDADSISVASHWRLGADEADRSVRVAARMDNAEPLLVERSLGRGAVLMSAISLGPHDSNLPTLKSYVPLVHELLYYLAAPLAPQLNVAAGSAATLQLDAAETAAVSVLTPAGRTRPASVTPGGQAARISFQATGQPGLYHFVLDSEPAGDGTEARRLPFVVVRDPRESRLALLGEGDLEMPGRHVRLIRFDRPELLIAALAGTVAGQELWKQLAICALVVLVAEIGLARWITVQRRSHRPQKVSFGDEIVDVRAFRARAEEMLSVPAAEASEEAGP